MTGLVMIKNTGVFMYRKSSAILNCVVLIEIDQVREINCLDPLDYWSCNDTMWNILHSSKGDR